MQVVRFIIPAVLALTLAACSEATPTPSPTPAPPTPTAAPLPTPTISRGPHPANTPTPEAFPLTVDGGTTWGDAFDAFTPAEQGCIRSAVDEDTLRRGMEQPLSLDESGDWEQAVYACVAPQTARTLFVAGFIASLESEGIEISGDDEACLREAMADVDISTIIMDEDSPAATEALSDIVVCIPDSFVDIIVQAVAGESGIALKPTAEQRGCLRDWVTGMGADAFSEDLASDIPVGLFACMSDVFVDIVLQAWLDEDTMGAIGEEERACVQESLEGLLELTPESLEGEDAESVFTIITLGVLGCLPSLPMEGETPQHPAVLWQYDAGSEPYAPAVRDGVAYVSAGNYVHAVDAATGTLLWRYGETYANHSPPATSDSVVYVGSNESGGAFVVALDAASGNVLWRFPTGGPVDFPPAVSGGTVYAASFDGFLYALDAETGALSWKFNASAYGWATAPVASGGTVYVAEGGALHALDAGTGAVRWRHGSDGAASSVILADGVLYVAEDGALYALDAGTGEVLQPYEGGELIPEIDVSGGMIYARTYGDDLVALSAQSGAVVWRFAGNLSSAPAVSDGVVYVGSFDGDVFAFDATTGALLAEYATGYSYVGGLSVSGGLVYAANGDGRLYAIDTQADADAPQG